MSLCSSHKHEVIVEGVSEPKHCVLCLVERNEELAARIAELEAAVATLVKHIGQIDPEAIDELGELIGHDIAHKAYEETAWRGRGE